MAKRRGGFTATEAWQADVRAALLAKGITPKDFARKMRCAQSTMHDLLTVKGKASHLIPKINRFFGWPSPEDLPSGSTPPLPTPAASEMAQMFDQLPEPLRKAKIEEMRALLATIKPSND